MALLKCKMCGGSLNIDRIKNLAVCDYCGTSSALYERDKQLYDQFEQAFAALLNQTADGKNAVEGFWLEAQEEEFTREDGTPILIRYLFKKRVDIANVYVARKNVIYLFAKQMEQFADHYVQTIERLQYPSGAMERELKQFLPKITMQCKLTNGSTLIAIEKPEEVYPLDNMGILIDRHAAWVVSRLENLCCLLSYNNLVLQGIKPENLFVDPTMHQIYLYGGWWYAKQGEGREDLEDLRLCAAKIMGYPDMKALERDRVIPEAFRRFLLNQSCRNAYEDFKKWDDVLIQAYGERRFIPLPVKAEMIYSNEKGEK